MRSLFGAEFLTVLLSGEGLVLEFFFESDPTSDLLRLRDPNPRKFILVVAAVRAGAGAGAGSGARTSRAP